LICAALVIALGQNAASPAASLKVAFRVHTFRFVDRSRTIRLPNGRRVPRPLETVVRYPIVQRSEPLVVFAHGYALTPATYNHLLDAWARAGYVVAAPVFPLGNANAPGGPDEADLVNQPRDISFVIGRLIAESAKPSGLLTGRVDSSRIAVAGHSDGGVTALGVAYDRRFRDRRIRAAIVMSGAALPGMGPFPARGPPLLAVQGTGDTINAPSTTAAFFRRAHRPKFLLWLLGAPHRPPYTDAEPQLGIVERATVAFLDHYLRRRPLHAFTEAARRSGLTSLIAQP
jgi:alpha-beta hydrolase superfamily lysophospholipase